jgi:subtilase family serine protease
MVSIHFLRPLAARNRKIYTCKLATALMLGVALPALAGAASPTARLFSEAEDAGPIAASTPLTAMVWLKGRNQDQFDAAVAARYDAHSSSYHRWMAPEEVASFGPTASDLATVKASLQAQGLKIEHISDDGAAVKVSGTAAKIQAAFGAPIHTFQSTDGRSFFANVTEPQYQGTHPELVDTITGLSNVGMQPYALRQTDLSTGQPRANIPAGTTANPLASFTSQHRVPERRSRMLATT